MRNRIFTGKSFNKKKCIQYLMIARYAKEESLRTKYLGLLFDSYKDIVEKNIHNFFSLCNKRGVKNDYEYYDLISEAYVNLHKCVENCKMQYKENFYWYYNKSLTRAFIRLIDKLKKNNNLEYVDNYDERDSLLSFIDYDFVDFYIQKINFTKLERLIIKHKIRGQLDIELFMKMHKLNKTKYKEIMERIKVKLIHLYEDK